jgi:hypothetical protein
MSTTVFTILPTTQAVIDEVREWMSEHPLASWSRARVAWHDDGYPNSTPVDVVPDGWEKTHEDGVWKKNGATVDARIRTVLVSIPSENGFTSVRNWDDQSDLPEAFAAADSMMERLGLLTPEPDANPWHKTDGMAPPREAGVRRVKTVDADGIWHKGPATQETHGWAHPKAKRRPIKWRYADGGGK